MAPYQFMQDFPIHPRGCKRLMIPWDTSLQHSVLVRDVETPLDKSVHILTLWKTWNIPYRKSCYLPILLKLWHLNFFSGVQIWSLQNKCRTDQIQRWLSAVLFFSSYLLCSYTKNPGPLANQAPSLLMGFSSSLVPNQAWS